MAVEQLSSRDRYRARFLTELDSRIEAILSTATTLQSAGLQTLPDDESESSTILVEAVDELYRHAHSIRGAAGTLGIEPAREAADIIAEAALHLNEEGILGDKAVWTLISRTAEGLALYGAACRAGQNPENTALFQQLPQLRSDFERCFAPPQDAADDFAEIARVLRLSDEEIEAFRFPTQHLQPAAALSDELTTAQVEAAEAVSMPLEAAASSAATPIEELETTQQEAVPADLAAELPITQELHEDNGQEEAPEELVAASEPVLTVTAPTQATQIDVPEAPATVQPAIPRVVTIFCESSLRLLHLARPALRSLEDDRWNTDTMRTVRRAFHTIKGDGRQTGFEDLAILAEAAEDIFDTIFDLQELEPNIRYGVPEAALPLINRTHQALIDMLSQPEKLAQHSIVADPLLIQALLQATKLVSGPESRPATKPDWDGAERRWPTGEEPTPISIRPQVWTADERRQRLLPAFLTEGRHLVDRLHQHIEVLRADPTDISALLGSTRALHTLKGNAATMQADAITQLAHAGETLLERVTLTADPVTTVQLGLLSDLEGALRHVIDTLDHSEPYDVQAIAPLIQALTAQATTAPTTEVAKANQPVTQQATKSTTVQGSAQATTAPVVRLDQVRVTARQQQAPIAKRAVEGAGGAASKRQAESPGTNAPKPIFMPRSSSEPERARAQRRSLTENITSVDLGAVDTAIDLFGRLVTSRTMIARGLQDLQQPATESTRNSQRLRSVIDKLAAEFEIVRRERRIAAAQREGWDPLELETFDTYTQIMLELSEIIADQEEIAGNLGEGVRHTSIICENDAQTTNDLQQSLLGFRLVRLNTIEPRLDQVIAATARAVGREVNWKLQSGSIALDKSVLDAIQEPLLHLLRNAIDHGLESPEERVAAGKSPVGSLTIDASYGANSIIIRVSDDGRGINPEQLAATAVRRGMITAETAASLDTRALLELIWQPGFSTASTVTDISGRGVGLDIVKAALNRVRGNVALQSTIGQGTTFILSLPLSLSVVRTLLLRDGNATVAAPIAQIEGVHLLRKADVTKLVDRWVAMIEGRTVSLMPQGLAQPISLEQRLSGESIVVIEVRVSAERTVGVLIDEVLGEEDTLVKALPRYLQHRTTFVGCSIAGNGQPYAIVDLHHFIEQFSNSSVESHALPSTLLPNVKATTSPVQQRVLIVDDSLFMRRSLAEVYEAGGFQVETAEDGEAALAVIARQGLPDLISLDMEMPRMNGLEMLAILRQLPGAQDLPVFMITTRGQERHRKAALSAGVTRYIIKPFNSDDLLAAALESAHRPLASSIA